MPSITPPHQGASELLRDRTVAELLGLHPRTLAGWRADRTNLPFVKIGHSVRYRASDVADYVERSRIQPHGPLSRDEGQE